jgi:hypothetical protein
MKKSGRVFMWLVVVFMFLTGAVHSLSLFVTPVAGNATEQQLLDLMANYKLDLGGGFHRSMNELVTALSSCFTLLCVLGALTDVCLLVKRVPVEIVKPLLAGQLIVFGICFALMAAFTFLPPMILSGLVFVFLMLMYVTNRKAAAA